MTPEEIEEMIKFGGVQAFRYCILNKLDFSMEPVQDDIATANELYEEMWVDENNMSSAKNEFTSKFNKNGI